MNTQPILGWNPWRRSLLVVLRCTEKRTTLSSQERGVIQLNLDPWTLFAHFRTTPERLLCPLRKIYSGGFGSTWRENHKIKSAFFADCPSRLLDFMRINQWWCLARFYSSFNRPLANGANRAGLAEHLNAPKTDSCGSWPFWVYLVDTKMPWIQNQLSKGNTQLYTIASSFVKQFHHELFNLLTNLCWLESWRKGSIKWSSHPGSNGDVIFRGDVVYALDLWDGISIVMSY